MIHNYPYTNFHDLNLDWIIEKVKTAIEGSYNPDNPPPYPVTSVNNQTGAVVIPVPVQSVNGQTGNVIIAIPVTSVNGKTGAVNVPFEDPDAGQLRLQQKMRLGTAWGIERDLVDDNEVTGFTIDTEATGAEDPPEFYVYVKRNNRTYQVRLLTAKDIPESSGVVSVNGMTGVVGIDASNTPYSAQKSTFEAINEKVDKSSIEDSLASTSAVRVLSAKQGYNLDSRLNKVIKENGLSYRYEGNADDLLTNGRYYMPYGTGTPSANDGCYIDVTMNSSNNAWGRQIYTNENSGSMFERIRKNGTWGDWQKIIVQPRRVTIPVNIQVTAGEIVATRFDELLSSYGIEKNSILSTKIYWSNSASDTPTAFVEYGEGTKYGYVTTNINHRWSVSQTVRISYIVTVI